MKHDVALDVFDQVPRQRGLLTVQALGELYHAVTRRGMLDQSQAQGFIERWRSVFRVVAANIEVLDEAMDVNHNHGLSFWDAMLWATAKQAGCAVVYSEDMQHGRRLGGVEIINPFI